MENLNFEKICDSDLPSLSYGPKTVQKSANFGFFEHAWNFVRTLKMDIKH
jgi:hypothetical protein